MVFSPGIGSAPFAGVEAERRSLSSAPGECHRASCTAGQRRAHRLRFEPAPAQGKRRGASSRKQGMSPRAKHENDTAVGVAYALGAFAWWGLNPFYFKLLTDLPLLEVLAHRILWSVLLLGFLIFVLRRGPHIRAALADGRTRLILA